MIGNNSLPLYSTIASDVSFVSGINSLELDLSTSQVFGTLHVRGLGHLLVMTPVVYSFVEIHIFILSELLPTRASTTCYPGAAFVFFSSNDRKSA